MNSKRSESVFEKSTGNTANGTACVRIFFPEFDRSRGSELYFDLDTFSSSRFLCRLILFDQRIQRFRAKAKQMEFCWLRKYISLSLPLLRTGPVHPHGENRPKWLEPNAEANRTAFHGPWVSKPVSYWCFLPARRRFAISGPKCLDTWTPAALHPRSRVSKECLSKFLLFWSVCLLLYNIPSFGLETAETRNDVLPFRGASFQNQSLSNHS